MDSLDQTFAAVLSLSVRATVLILAFATIRRLGRRWLPPGVIYLGWIVIALRLLVPLSVPVEWHRDSAEASPLNQWIDQTASKAALFATSFPNEIVGAGSTEDAPVAHARAGRASIGTLTPWQWGAVIWLSGVVGLSMTRTWAAWQFRRRVSHLREESDPRLMAIARIEAKRIGLKGSPNIVTSRAIDIPAIMGVWRSRLLFPSGLARRLSDEELCYVIRHELGHLRRRDLLAQALINAAQIVHWFNPFAWFAAFLARRDCETACDESVTRDTSSAEARAYGSTLLKVLREVCRQNPSPAALGIFESKNQIKRRIFMITHFRSSALRRVFAAVSVMGLVALTSLSLKTSAADNTSDAGGSGDITTIAPVGWFENGSERSSYVVGVDRTQAHVLPHSAYVKSIKSHIDGFGGMMQTFDAKNYLGKRVRFSAYLKTIGADEGAHLWMRIDGVNNKMVGFDNMNDRPVKGTVDWTQCQIVLDVPEDSEDINFGFFISGTGQAWVNDATFEIVGRDVPTTKGGMRSAPVNLSFDPAMDN